MCVVNKCCTTVYMNAINSTINDEVPHRSPPVRRKLSVISMDYPLLWMTARKITSKIFFARGTSLSLPPCAMETTLSDGFSSVASAVIPYRMVCRICVLVDTLVITGLASLFVCRVACIFSRATRWYLSMKWSSFLIKVARSPMNLSASVCTSFDRLL